MKRTALIFLFFVFYLLPFSVLSQEVEKIKIKKEDPFLKAEYDETNYRVIALDKYGNPYENVVKSFVITFQDLTGQYKTEVTGNTIPEKTIKYLKSRKKATNLCLKQIVAQDEDGHIQSLPDRCGVLFYPDCKGCKTNNLKK